MSTETLGQRGWIIHVLYEWTKSLRSPVETLVAWLRNEP